MAKSQKNKDYLDQVYYALGNIYLNREDTLNAIKNYQLGIDKSTQNGMDKAICQIKLGDIYFTQRDYVKAQPCFSGALAGLKKEYKEYARVSKLSAVLDELVVYVEAVQLQDSLQALAKMPEAERLAIIDKKIEEVKKEEEEAKALAEKEAYLAEQEAKGSGINRPGTETNTVQMPTAGGASFYFYNPQTVAQGKTQFQRKWGRRTLEDNWRRRKKELSTFDEPNMEEAENAGEPQVGADGQPLPTDSIAGGDLPAVAADDPHTREYYLQQLPFTEEDVAASNVIIEDGLYNMAMIYKDKLEDLSLSIEGFETLERRFPENSHRLESYYQIYLMALRLQDAALAAAYKTKLMQAFPESGYAVAVADPNYEYNIRMMDRVQDSLYQQTYDRYLASDTTTVRRSFKLVSEKYPLATLMPKFMFLDALTYVQAGDTEGFKAALRTLIEKYPKADVTELAGEMLKGVLRGRTLVQGGVRGMSWNLRFGVGEDGSLSAEDSARVFNPERNAPYEMLLVYPTGSVDQNQLLFAVAAYNFANFMVKEFDLAFEEAGPISMLAIKGFYNFDEIIQYYKMIYGADGYATALNKAVAVLPISEANYETLMRGKTLEEYISFFDEQFGEELPDLAARWKARLEEELVEEDAKKDEVAPEEIEVEAPAAVKPTEEPKEEIQQAQEEQSIILLEQLEKEPAPIRVDSMAEPVVANEKPLLIDTVRIDSISVVQPPVEEQGLTLKEIQEIRKQEAAAEEAKRAEARKAFEEQQKADEVLRQQKAKEQEALRKQQAEEEQALLKAKADREKQLEADRKAKLKQAEAERKAKLKAREELRKEKERAYKERLKQKEKERKEKERAYKQKLKEKEKARKEALRAKEQAAKAKRNSKR